MLDRELIDKYKAAWIPHSERFPESAPALEVTKHGSGICKYCGIRFAKLTATSVRCASDLCRKARNRASQAKRYESPEYREKMARRVNDRYHRLNPTAGRKPRRKK